MSGWCRFAGSTLARSCGALQYMVGGTNADTNALQRAYHYEFGVASTKIGHTLYRSTGTNEVGITIPDALLFKSLAAGTQLMVRGFCSGTTPEPHDVAAYAVS